MKRNWDTIREILLKVEECTLPTEAIELSSFSNDKSAEISYHMNLLIDAGLVKGQVIKTLGTQPQNFLASGLSWEGHEFLDSIRNNDIWDKTKSTFVEKGIEMTFELVRSGATRIATAMLSS